MALNAEDEDGSPYVIIPPTVADQRIVPGPVSQEQREDTQILSFLAATACTGPAHPLSISPGADPPDRLVSAVGEDWAVELTELTVADLRRDLARARRFGREFSTRLRSRLSQFPHLAGRSVQLGSYPEVQGDVPKNTAALMSELEAVLAEDKGYLGEGADFSDGLPETIPMRGDYGQVGPFLVSVHPYASPTETAVVASVQAHLYERDALALLQKRIDEKDIAANQILLIACGLPDERGLICPLDVYLSKIIHTLKQKDALLIKKPDHLDGVIVHNNRTGEAIEVFRRSGASVPWGG